MHLLAQLPPDFWAVVVIIFGGVFLYVLISLADAQATGGWGSFAKRYPAPSRPEGNVYSVLSCSFGGVSNRGNGVRVIFTDAGIYFYKTFLGRLAHPPFILPWESVSHVEKGHGFLGEYYIVKIKDIAGTFSLDLHQKAGHDLSRYHKVPITYSPEPK